MRFSLSSLTFMKSLFFQCHTQFNNEFKCYECDYVNNQWVVMRRHLWKKHDIEAGIQTCNICGFKSERNFEYEDHMRTHGNKYIYKCTICNRMFKSYKLMKNHERYHGPHYLKNPEGELQCPVCRCVFYYINIRLFVMFVCLFLKVRRF